LVELVGHYSNPDEWAHLADIVHPPARPAVDIEAWDESTVRPSCSRRPWPVVDRLGDETVQQLLRDRRSGMMQRALAKRYGISLSSVKRILRKPPNV
jgi:hypothetical protein